jgi:hypothetical protein
MNDFGKLTEVVGDLWFSNHVYQENLESIKPLKKVYGDLNLRKTTCRNISSLKRVGRNVLVSKSQMNNFVFSKVEIIGKIKTFNDEFNEGKLTTPNY